MSQLADSVSFELGDTRHVLRLTPGAWIELEDLGFGNVNTLAANLQANPSFKTFVAVFAAALRGGAPGSDVSDADALTLADQLGSGETIALVSKVVEAAFPPPPKGAVGNAKKPPAPTK